MTLPNTDRHISSLFNIQLSLSLSSKDRKRKNRKRNCIFQRDDNLGNRHFALKGTPHRGNNLRLRTSSPAEDGHDLWSFQQISLEFVLLSNVLEDILKGGKENVNVL